MSASNWKNYLFSSSATNFAAWMIRSEYCKNAAGNQMHYRASILAFRKTGKVEFCEKMVTCHGLKPSHLFIHHSMIFGADYTFAEHSRWNLGWPSPNYAAAFLATVLPWCWLVPFAVRRVRPGVRRIVFVGISIVEICFWFGLLKTYSRGGLMAALAAGICVSICCRSCLSRHKLALAVTLRICYLAAVTLLIGFWHRLAPGFIVGDASVLNRLELWRGALRMIAASPLRGWGFGESGAIYTNWFQPIGAAERYTGTVNSFLQVAVELGLPTFGLVLAGIWTLGRSGRLKGPNLNAGTSKKAPVLAVAKGSVLAWLSANLFTTLWLDYRLWIIPGIACMILLIAAHSLGPGSFLRQSAIGIGLGTAAAACLWIAGLSISRRFDLAVSRGSGDAVVATKRGEPGDTSNKAGSQDWEIWPDRKVLGPFPGQEIRLLLESMPTGTRFFTREAAPRIARPRQIYGEMLFGRQVGRLGDLRTAILTAGQVWIVHPFGRAELRAFFHFRSGTLNVVLPEIDQYGQGGYWQSLARSSDARVLISIGAGSDIRQVWPEVLRLPARTKNLATMPASSRIIAPDKVDAATISLPPDQQRLWLDIQARFQGIGLDGTWRQSYQLPSSRSIRGLAFSCRLEQRVELDAGGHPYTSWIIPALETWIVPDGRDKVQFLPPSGTPIQFQINQITGTFDGSGLSAWKIRRTSRGSFDLLSPNRSIWTYSHGLLKTISISNSERFAVQTDGGMIREVRSLSPVSADPLLSADYDEYGDPVRVDLGGPGPSTLHWENGELREMKRGSGKAIVFTYFHGLISTIQVSGRPDVHVTWCENPHFSRGDSWWYAPVSLGSDGSFDYRYSVTDEGYLINVTNRATRERSTMLFNPMRHKLLHHDSVGRVFLVTFKNDAAGTSPEQVEILEKLTHW